MYKVDLHIHTSRYSPCSRIDPGDLVQTATKTGLDTIVITEHGKPSERPMGIICPIDVAALED